MDVVTARPVGLVTGGAGGFGRAFARRLAARGHAVVVADLDAEGAAEVAASVGGVAVRADVSRPEDTVAAVRRIVGVNQDAVVYGLDAAVPALRASGGGKVVVTASLAGLVPMPADPLYTLTKTAVVAYVRALGPPLAEVGVTVTALCPGFADTAIVDPLRVGLSAAGLPLLTVDEVGDAFLAVLDEGQPGQAWFVQPGRPPGPYGFRGVPGPRA